MTREEAKQLLRNHPDEQVQEALRVLCLWASTDTVDITVNVDNGKAGETIQAIVDSGILARANELRLAHKGQ